MNNEFNNQNDTESTQTVPCISRAHRRISNNGFKLAVCSAGTLNEFSNEHLL